MSFKEHLVSVSWLEQHLDHSNLILLDASMNNSVHTQVSSSLVTIPNSRHFDFETVFVDKNSTLSNMMPTESDFNREAKLLGVNNDSTIVVFDQKGIFSSARAWYMFHVMGHKNIKILNGGLPAWIDAGLPTTQTYLKAGTHGHVNGNFNGSIKAKAFCDANYVLSKLDNTNTKVIDARAPGRFKGTVAEPRANMRSGHIPNSINIPFTSLLTQNTLKSEEKSFTNKSINNKYLNEKQLKAIIDKFTIDLSSELIFSCGSGVTACVVLFVFYCLGYQNVCVYDGSWSEWGANDQLPISNAK